MNASSLIHKYLDFFKEKGHAVLPSASLIPANDASVLFNTAGMQPLVPYLMGGKHPKGTRLVNVQKCIRTVDFENIGDNTHHTFFQMLGNWSLGDYFKKEAISWSFEFLTSKKWLNIPVNKLAVTVYQGDKAVPRDEESYALWRSVGISEERIAFLGKDNFWIAGETGPCGPSTEMFYWTGDGKAPPTFDPNDNHWVEIWNDVFMAYEKGKVSTIFLDGMGCIYDDHFQINNELLRLVQSFQLKVILVVNGYKEKAETLVREYGWDVFSCNGTIKKEEEKFFTQCLAHYSLQPGEVIYIDHLDANVQGAQKAGIKKRLLYSGKVSVVSDFVENNLFYFHKLKQHNVDTGMGLERTLAILNGKKSAYETNLFLPLIQQLEKQSKKKYAQEQRSMRIIADHIRASVFILGDENAVLPSNVDRGYILRRLIRRIVRYGKMIGINTLFTAELAKIVVKEYGDLYPELEQNKEQVCGELQKEEEKFEHTLEKGLKEFEQLAERGNLSGTDAFLLFQSYGFPLEMTEELAVEKGIKVDVKGFLAEYEKHKELSRSGAEKKFKGGLADNSPLVIRMHTATHLLNEVLRKIISPSIHQRGSNITPERLRFDFSFERKLTPEEVKKVEDEMNRVIKQDLKVVRKEMPLKEAEKLGAEKEFGAKYPDIVSVYFVGNYSKEFCGGPHVTHTAEIGRFKILKEESVAAGVRRIKAIVE